MTSELPSISIEVVYALAQEQQLISLKLTRGTTASAALRLVLEQSLIVFPDTHCPTSDEQITDPVDIPVGVHGQVVPDDYVMKEGDRLELYRPLLQDPMERRRKVAKQSK